MITPNLFPLFALYLLDPSAALVKAHQSLMPRQWNSFIRKMQKRHSTLAYGLLFAVALIPSALANDSKHLLESRPMAKVSTGNLLSRPLPINTLSSSPHERRSIETDLPIPVLPKRNGKRAENQRQLSSLESTQFVSEADLVYVLEHSSTISGEADTLNSAGIDIWSAPNQGLYGVASQDLGQ